MISPKVLKPKVMEELRSGFSENNPKGVQVQGFMSPEDYKKFLASVANANFHKSERRDTHSYFEATVKALEFFGSKEFASFVESVIGKKAKLESCSLKMFMHGSYTLMSDYADTGKIEFYFDMTPEWNNESGGATVFVTEEGEKLILPPAPNTLVIAESGRSYVKYVNHLAGNDGRLMAFGSLKY